MKTFLKRFTALASATVLCMPVAGEVVSAEDAIDLSPYGMGSILLSATEEHQLSLMSNLSDFPATVSSTASLPSVKDLSTSVYFPEISSQGSIGSCTAWASTYYQYTYEANKLNQLVTTAQNTYSPAWTYNLTYTANGSNLLDCYTILMNHGALRMQDYPYDANNYSYALPTDTEPMIEALSTRVLGYDNVKINTTTDKITTPSDTQLNAIKSLLADDEHVLVVRLPMSGDDSQIGVENWSVGQTDENEWVVYRAVSPSQNTGHAMTVVGYDDTIEYDVNGNNIIESCEKGAFKVANSWGDSWANDGYIWIMYDALNLESANTINDWENSYTGSRISVFDPTGINYNEFFYVVTENHTVNLVALLNLTTPNRHYMNIYTNRGTGTSFPSTGSQWVYSAMTIPSSPYFVGTLVLDFGSLDDSIANYLSGYKWFVQLKNRCASSINNISMQIVDNKQNIVVNSGTIPAQVAAGGTITGYASVNLQRGDVDYNGVLNSTDAQIMLNYVVKIIEYSDLQNVIGDYNQDGKCNNSDVLALNKALSSTESAAFIEYVRTLYLETQTDSMQKAYRTHSDEYMNTIEEIYNALTKEEFLCVK